MQRRCLFSKGILDDLRKVSHSMKLDLKKSQEMISIWKDEFEERRLGPSSRLIR